MPPANNVPQTAVAAEGDRRWVRVPAVACDHVRFSTQFILEAARATPGDDAIVLGAGRCQEIPLAALADRFPRLTLNDHDESLLDAALAESGLVDAGRAPAVTKLAADLTGVTLAFLGMVDAVLAGAGDTSAEAVAERLAKVADATTPVPFSTGRRHDLVVASCVLCQLHLSAWKQAVTRFGARFPGREAVLQQSPAFVPAMFRLARRMEDTFVDALHGLVAPRGRIFFSDTVHCAMLHGDPGGGWLTEGFLRMTRTPELNDYLDGRFRIEQAGRWHWVMEPSKQEGRVGRLFRVQAFVLSPDEVV
jgi:hypothetical protein